MRQIVLLILGVGLLTSISSSAFSEKPLRLFFEKSIVAKPVHRQEEHKVQSGEWLYKILANKGYSATEIQILLPTILKDNPHLTDINRLKAGQVLLLPPHKHSELPVSSSPPDQALVQKQPTEHQTYIINPGDRLWSILQQQQIPPQVTMGQRIELFQQLNPEILNIHQLKVGQEVRLPVWPAQSGQSTASLGTGTQDHSNISGPAFGKETEYRPDGPSSPSKGGSTQPVPLKPRSNVDIIRSMLENKPSEDNSTVAREPRTGWPFIRSVLKQMNFTFVSGDEIIYSLPFSGWLHVNLLETPIIESPWGSKILLCSTPKNSEWLDKVKALNIQVCSLDESWTLKEVFTQLNKNFPKNFRLWSQEKELVLARNGLNLSLKSPYIAVVEQVPHKTIYVLWSRAAIEEPPLPQGLPEVLEPSKIKIIELDSFNEISRLPARPSGAVLVNLASVPELIRAIDTHNAQSFLGPTPPQTMHELLELLKNKKLLRQSMIRTAWIRGSQRLIAVQVPAWTISSGQNTIALLDRRFANEHLFSLLAHEGYTCFILPD